MTLENYEQRDEHALKVWLVSVLIGRDIYRDAAQELSELASSCGYDVLGLTEAKRSSGS
nr:hypothetical protein [uncultured Parasutterella sp.]